MKKVDIDIINIIGDCMDKSICKKCIIKTELNKEYFEIEFIEKNIRIGDIVHFFDENLTLIGYRLNEKNHMVLGHYGITSIQKYIGSKGLDLMFTEKGMLIYGDKNINDDIGIIPHKELHLFTQEEKENLLDLLLKVKNYAR